VFYRREDAKMADTWFEHERLVAVEWLVKRLAIEISLLKSNPLQFADQVVADGYIYADAIFDSSLQNGSADHQVIALSVASSIRELVEEFRRDLEPVAMPG
jgi:hypothetical protein